jgi:hypothetical protein
MRIARLLSIPVLVAAAQTAHADSKACKAGALVFGDPNYVHKNGEDPNPVGQTVRQNPPLAWDGFAFAGDKVYTVSGLGQEIWGGPVAGGIKRLAGETQSLSKFAEGPCGEARFGYIWGLAVLRDGTVIAADNRANAILTITDIDKPTCKVAVLVGPKKALGDASSAPVGDTDGPAASAVIGRPGFPVVDGSGNIYFIDGAANKVKMIAADAAHTVSTLGQLRSGQGVEPYHGLTMLEDKLYAATSTVSNGIVQEVDPATKKVRTVKDGGGSSYPPIDANHSPALSAIANDGNNLLLFGRGYVWRMTPQGNVSLVAGSGWDLDYPKGYNPTGVYPTNAIKLYYEFSMGAAASNAYLVWNKDSIYWRGKKSGPYVVKIDCK